MLKLQITNYKSQINPKFNPSAILRIDSERSRRAKFTMTKTLNYVCNFGIWYCILFVVCLLYIGI